MSNKMCNDCWLSMQNCHDMSICCEMEEYYGDECDWFEPMHIVHGHWIERTDYVGDTYYDCSACGESWTTIEGDPWDNGMNYCPKCGAKMDDLTHSNDSNTLDALEMGKQCD